MSRRRGLFTLVGALVAGWLLGLFKRRPASPA